MIFINGRSGVYSVCLSTRADGTRNPKPYARNPNVGALIFRKGFGGIVYYNYLINKELPKPYSNEKAPT